VRAWTSRAVIATLIVAGSYLVYEFGRIQAGYNVVDAASERQDYAARIDTLEDEIIALKEQIALLETHRDIDSEAYREVEASLTELQTKIQEQRDSIAFYRGIVSPTDGKSGLRVQNLRLTRGKAEREYNIRLVLIQAMKHDRKVSGDVNLSIAGDQNGVETTYTYAQLLSDETPRKWNFSFRYFQDFDRQIVLPDGFTPERVNIEVRSRTRSIKSIEESFSWPTSQG
jgi:phage host-nuclease inhibitor protein Gam